ncbi:MAG: 5-oxoprolinase subunit PxpB [Burkholderiales bacterium]|nr:5-oxoprolinase subunit PxpB [Burkholderiales bacterium]
MTDTPPRPRAPRIAFFPLGDRALVIELGGRVSESGAALARRLADAIEAARIPGVREAVSAFSSVSVHYDPARMKAAAAPDQAGIGPYQLLQTHLQVVCENLGEEEAAPGVLVEVPVCYGGDYGEDLGYLALAHELAPAKVVELHTRPVYYVGMLGFMPGFPYLVGLDQRLVTPRRATPRPSVPRGSVAIGGQHTGIYPLDSPGGWHVIGRTPLALFDQTRDPPSLFQAGDRVRFVSVTPERYEQLLAGAA